MQTTTLGRGGPVVSRAGLGLMGAPSFFFRADPKGVLDKLDPRIMHNQVSMISKMYVLMDRLTPAQLKGETPISDADLFG